MRKYFGAPSGAVCYISPLTGLRNIPGMTAINIPRLRRCEEDSVSGSRLFQRPFSQHEAAVAEVCEALVVRGDEGAGARLAAEGEEERADLRAGARVEVAGRLVREDEARARDEGAGDGHALLLAPRKFPGRVREALGQP